MKGTYYVVKLDTEDESTAPDVFKFEERSKMCAFRKLMKLMGHETRQVSPSFVKKTLDEFGGVFEPTLWAEEYSAMRYYPDSIIVG